MNPHIKVSPILFFFYLAQSFCMPLQLNAISPLTQFSPIISLLVWLTRYTGYRLRMTRFPPRRIRITKEKSVWEPKANAR